MFEIGSLVAISKTFLDSFSILKDVLKFQKAAPEPTLLVMKEKINEFQSRLV